MSENSNNTNICLDRFPSALIRPTNFSDGYSNISVAYKESSSGFMSFAVPKKYIVKNGRSFDVSLGAPDIERYVSVRNSDGQYVRISMTNAEIYEAFSSERNAYLAARANAASRTKSDSGQRLQP